MVFSYAGTVSNVHSTVTHGRLSRIGTPTPLFTVKLAVRTEGMTMHEKSRCVAMQGTTIARLAPVKTGKSTGGVVRCEDFWVELGRRSEVRAEVTQSNLQHSENKNGLALGNETHSLL